MMRSPSDPRRFPRAPLPLTETRADYFPTTQATSFFSSSPSHANLAAIVMARYAEPLAIYARGTSLREIAEPAELVHGFFAAALSNEDYFTRYRASGMRLRRWLMNGLLLHARGVTRDRARAMSREGAPLSENDEPISASSDASESFDRAWALALLSEACMSVEAALLAEGRDPAWTVFRRHAIDGRSYEALESELGLRRQQMADLVRSVTKRLRTRMAELLVVEGGNLAEELRDVIRLVR